MFKKILLLGLIAVLGILPFKTSFAANTAEPAGAVCPSFSRSLSLGISGNDVLALQKYLNTHGFVIVASGPGSTGNETKYFGSLTQAAVARFQAQGNVVALGGYGSGTFGPLSRAYFARICNDSSTVGIVQSTAFSASPQSGTAPLTVQFTSTAPQGGTVGGSVTFGDGQSGSLVFAPTCSSCNLLGSVSHTYTATGTYIATLTSGSCSCPANGICNCPLIKVLATTTVTVSPSTSTSSSDIKQINAPASVTLAPNGIAEIRNENMYFTLQSLTATTATIQPTAVGCWNSFPSDTPPKIRCMIAVMPIASQTLSAGQTYTSGKSTITLQQIANGAATFSIK